MVFFPFHVYANEPAPGLYDYLYETEAPRFREGLYLDNVKLSDFTHPQAYAYFHGLNEQRRQDFLITVMVNDKEYPLKASSFQWRSNVLELLDELWLKSQSDEPIGVGLAYYSSFGYEEKKLASVVENIASDWTVVTGKIEIKNFDMEKRAFNLKENRKLLFDKKELESKLEDAIYLITENKEFSTVEISVVAEEGSSLFTPKETSGKYGLLGTYTTYTTNVPNRNTNIRLAGEAVHGICLEPGEVFSFNNTIGPTTVAKGYKVAGILVNGKPSEGMGGGICQLSSTIYNAVLEANLKVVERRAHSASVGYVPAGRDATVSYGTLDFRFQNTTGDKLYIAVDYSNSALTVSLYGRKPA